MIVYQKARIFDPSSPTDGFSVQFNPNTLEYSAGIERRTDKYTQIKPQKKAGHQMSPLGEEKNARLSVKLFFHSYTSDLIYSDVRPTINRIRAFLPKNESQNNISPRISFAWGTLTHTGTLESFHVTYQMFAFDGTPVQAEVSITIRGEDPEVSSSFMNQVVSSMPSTDILQQEDTVLLSSVSWLFQ